QSLDHPGLHDRLSETLTRPFNSRALQGVRNEDSGTCDNGGQPFLVPMNIRYGLRYLASGARAPKVTRNRTFMICCTLPHNRSTCRFGECGFVLKMPKLNVP